MRLRHVAPCRPLETANEAPPVTTQATTNAVGFPSATRTPKVPLHRTSSPDRHVRVRNTDTTAAKNEPKFDTAIDRRPRFGVSSPRSRSLRFLVAGENRLRCHRFFRPLSVRSAVSIERLALPNAFRRFLFFVGRPTMFSLSPGPNMQPLAWKLSQASAHLSRHFTFQPSPTSHALPQRRTRCRWATAT